MEGRKIGDLARASGLTVRTLHHYEDVGLLRPGRTDAGHRLYGDDEVERLYRVIQLRRLGLSLGEIRRALDDDGCDVADVMRRQLAELDRRLEATSRLRSRLVSLLASAHPASEDLLDLLEEATMLEGAPQRRIGILVYRDLEAAFRHLVDVFGLGPGEITRMDGQPVHAEIEAGDGVLWLHPESPEFGLASPQTAGVATGMVAVMVDDVDAHFRHASSRGASIVYEPVDQPYGYREYSARDAEGGFWSFMQPLADAG